MADISSLLEKGYINRASTQVYDALRYLINTKLPHTELSKEEFDVLIPLVVNKIKAKALPSDKTPQPGDDIELEKSKGWLVVTSVGPKELKVPPIYIQPYSVGTDYVYEVPQFEGYVSDFTVIRGKMSINNVHIVVEYEKIPDDAKEPVYGKIYPKKDNEGSDKGYVNSTDEANFKLVDAGKYYLDTFWSKDCKMLKKLLPDVTINNRWWPGVVLHVPESLKSDDAYKKVLGRYFNPKTGEWTSFRLSQLPQLCKKTEKCGDCEGCDKCEDCDYITEEDEPVLVLWLPVTIDDLKYPNGSDGMYHQLIQLDWNGDDLYEQNFDIAIDPGSIELYNKKEDEIPVWPEDY